MNKKFFSAVLLVVMLAALMVFATGCSSSADEESAARIAQLEQENTALKAQIEAMSAQLSDDVKIMALESWNLDVQAWNDGNGATVTFTAKPVSYTEGQRAALSVRMGNLEAESTNCVWDAGAAAFTGSVELSAADGYSYYCILTNLDGTQQEIVLNSPSNVTNETLVYLGSNLSAYANIIVEDWSASDSAMEIKSCHLQAQMPRLTADGKAASVSSAALVLKLNDEEIERKAVTLKDGEGEGSFEASASESFTMPDMEEDYQLDLWLEVTLSTGNTITASGGSWYFSDGALQLAVG